MSHAVRDEGINCFGEEFGDHRGGFVYSTPPRVNRHDTPSESPLFPENRTPSSSRSLPDHLTTVPPKQTATKLPPKRRIWKLLPRTPPAPGICDVADSPFFCRLDHNCGLPRPAGPCFPAISQAKIPGTPPVCNPFTRIRNVHTPYSNTGRSSCDGVALHR